MRRFFTASFTICYNDIIIRLFQFYFVTITLMPKVRQAAAKSGRWMSSCFTLTVLLLSQEAVPEPVFLFRSQCNVYFIFSRRSTCVWQLHTTSFARNMCLKQPGAWPCLVLQAVKLPLAVERWCFCAGELGFAS